MNDGKGSQQAYDRSALKSGAVYMFANILFKAGNILLIPIYTAFVSAEEYGQFSLFMSMALLMNPFVSLAGDALIPRFYFLDTQRSHEIGRIFQTINAFLIANALIVGLIIWYWGERFFTNTDNFRQLSDYVGLALIAGISLVWIKVYSRYLKASQDTKIIPLINFLRFVFQAAVSLVLLLVFRFAGDSLIYGFLISSLLIGGYSFYKFTSSFPPKIHRSVTREVIEYALPLVPNRFAAFTAFPIQNFIIAGIGDFGLLGVYYVASLVGNGVTLLLQNVTEALQPWLYQNFRDKQRGDEAIRQTLSTITLFIFCIVISGAGLSVVIVPFLVGDEFQESAKYIPIFMLFSFSNYIKNIALFLLMYFPGGTKTVTIGTYVNIALMLVLTYLLITPFGLYGAAWSLFLARYISSEITIYFSKKYCEGRDVVDWWKIRVLLYITVAFFGLGVFLVEYSPWLYLLGSFLIVLVTVISRYENIRQGLHFLWLNVSRRKEKIDAV